MNRAEWKYKIAHAIKMLMASFAWLLLVVLLLVAFNLKSPYLFIFRQYETPALLLICGVAYLAYFRRIRGFLRGLSHILLLAVVILTFIGEACFQYHKYTVLNNDMEMPAMLGEHFIIGYKTVDEIAPLVRQGLIGGVFITRRNTAGKGVEELRQEIEMLQQMRAEAGLRPLMITTDQEGGIVSHMSPPLEQMPALASLVSDGVSKEVIIDKAFAYGQAQGRGLAALGVTVNFSPVVDLMPQTMNRSLDFHSHIAQRAVSADPELVRDVATAYVKGLNTEGIYGTLKHFPGLGHVPDDTHHFSAVLDIPVDELQHNDWVPFRDVGRLGGAFIMVGHVVVSFVDRENPASFSKPVVQGIIRDGWLHEGVLVTDDMTMRAAYRHDLCNATVKALNAGMDLILISYDYEKFYDVFYCVNKAYEDGSLDTMALNRSRERLRQLVYRNH